VRASSINVSVAADSVYICTEMHECTTASDRSTCMFHLP